MGKPTPSLDFGAADVEVVHIFSNSMSSVCNFYDGQFEEIYETHDTEVGVSINGKPNLVLTGYPKNLLWVHGQVNSKCDFL